ncbi:MAG: YbjQ family protein [Kiritimatiellae bacterium]|nr:YbjQ family protein [Kiritimatiellia bacterium]
MNEEAKALQLLLVYVVLPTVVLFTGWAAGHIAELRHEKSLRRREDELRDIEATTTHAPEGFAECGGTCSLVSGEAVVGSDAFKSWVFSLKNVVGGESRTFTRLFDRARREALVRMKEQARALGCNAICNVRFDCADIGGNATGANRKSRLNMAVALVSGTAWRRG